jgi:small subunit ribosomal protein S20
MPNIKSQKDRVVQAAAEQAHNKAIKTNLKTVVKKADAAIDANAADKDATVLAAVSAIDKARAKGVIKKNTASRKISRMAKRANKNAWSQFDWRTKPLYRTPVRGFLFFYFSGCGVGQIAVAAGLIFSLSGVSRRWRGGESAVTRG